MCSAYFIGSSSFNHSFVLDILTLFSLILRNKKKIKKENVQSVFLNYTESLAPRFRDSLAFGWAEKGIGWSAAKWLSIHSLHFAQDFALIHGQHSGILPHFLKHGTTLELITGFLEVVPEEEKQRDW